MAGSDEGGAFPPQLGINDVMFFRKKGADWLSRQNVNKAFDWSMTKLLILCKSGVRVYNIYGNAYHPRRKVFRGDETNKKAGQMQSICDLINEVGINFPARNPLNVTSGGLSFGSQG